MKVLIDMDGIIVDLWGPWFGHYEARTGEAIPIESVTAWDLPGVQHRDVLFKMLSEPGFYQGLPAYPGAVEGVRKLVDAGDEVYILSAAPSVTSWSEKAWWVENHLPFVKQKNIILTHAKELVHGDVLFDDGPHNLKAVRMSPPPLGTMRLATVVYPYNECEALSYADCVAGSYEDMPKAWDTFVAWMEDIRNG